ncbi:MAG: glycosyltransferase [Rhodothermia bacterium]
MEADRTVTYLTTGLRLGGAEIQMSNLASGFVKRGWRVIVVSMLPTESPLDNRLTASGVTVVSLNMRPWVPNPIAVSKLAGMLRDSATDVLHSHMVKANILGRLARKLTRVPVQISTAHNTIEGGRWVQWAYRLTDSMADMTTNVSRRAVDRYIEIRAVPADRIRLVRNGLDVSQFEQDLEGRRSCREELGLASSFVWIAVGRLAPAKDYGNMLDAFKAVVSRRSDARLLIVGDGPLEAEIAKKVKTLGLTESVLTLGERTDVPALMNAADAYVMSSAWEGAPIVLLEASASRLPIVATDVGGNSELVVHGETGLVVQPHDPAALGDTMIRIMAASPEDRAEMGRAGRERTENEFGLEAILDQWETMYVELLTQTAGHD